MKYKNLYKVNKYQKDQNIIKTNNPNICDLISKYSTSFIDSDIGITYSLLGHSSIYLKLNNKRILIDPVFLDNLCNYQINIFERAIKPIPNNHDFNEIDAILITHKHKDHLDIKTLKSFEKQTKCFIVPLGIKEYLIKNHIPNNKIIELKWGEYTYLNGIEIHMETAIHNSGFNLFDQNKSLWCSYVIKSDNYQIYHSGDTAYSKHFKDIQNKYEYFDLAFIECGQYGSLWHNLHMFPEESVKAAKDLNSKLTIPIHNRTYSLSFHSFNEPIERFKKEANKKGIKIYIPEFYQINNI